jgi:hypothetical protein
MYADLGVAKGENQCHVNGCPNTAFILCQRPFFSQRACSLFSCSIPWNTHREKTQVVENTKHSVNLQNGPHFNPFTASCENAMTFSVPGVPVSCEKFPHSIQLNFWSTKSIFNQFSVFVKTLNALCVCLQYKHLRSMKRVIRSNKPVTLLFLLWSH